LMEMTVAYNASDQLRLDFMRNNPGAALPPLAQSNYLMIGLIIGSSYFVYRCNKGWKQAIRDAAYHKYLDLLESEPVKACMALAHQLQLDQQALAESERQVTELETYIGACVGVTASGRGIYL
jgi:hypothetical protein